MDDSKTALVFLGNRTREVTFSPLPDESDGKALDRAIREVFADLELNQHLILKEKSEKWDGVFVDVLPESEIKTGSVLQAIIIEPSKPEASAIHSNITAVVVTESQPSCSLGEQGHLAIASDGRLQLCNTAPKRKLRSCDDKVFEKAKIFKKVSSRPLTEYQKQINIFAGNIAVENPALLCKRGELLELARTKVCESGYEYKKGKSRMNTATSKEKSTKPSRLKISADMRCKKISSLDEQIANLNEQISFKEKRRQQAEAVRNYKICEEITEQMGIVKQQRRDLQGELKVFQEKERKANWYAQKRRRGVMAGESSSTVVSDDSDVPLSSRSSSQIPESPLSPISISSDMEASHPGTEAGSELGSNSDSIDLCNEDDTDSFLSPGLPVLPTVVQEGSPNL